MRKPNVLICLFLGFLVFPAAFIIKMEDISAACCKFTITSHTPIYGGPPPYFTGSCTSSTGPVNYANFSACNTATIAPACGSTGCTASGGCSVSATPVAASLCPY